MNIQPFKLISKSFIKWTIELIKNLIMLKPCVPLVAQAFIGRCADFIGLYAVKIYFPYWLLVRVLITLSFMQHKGG